MKFVNIYLDTVGIAYSSQQISLGENVYIYALIWRYYSNNANRLLGKLAVGHHVTPIPTTVGCLGKVGLSEVGQIYKYDKFIFPNPIYIWDGKLTLQGHSNVATKHVYNDVTIIYSDKKPKDLYM